MTDRKNCGASLYMGEGRIALIPDQPHKSGLTIGAGYCIILTDVFNAKEIGNAVFEAIEYSKNCSVSQMTWKEESDNAVWKKITKYKTWNLFWKNNLAVDVDFRNDKQYHIVSYKRSTQKGRYDGLAEYIKLPYTATAEEIGQAVINVLQAAEEFHANIEKEKQLQEQEKK